MLMDVTDAHGLFPNNHVCKNTGKAQMLTVGLSNQTYLLRIT